VAFLGARLKVTAVLLYADGIRVECLVAPLPDASNETLTDEDGESWVARARPHEAAALRRNLQVDKLLLRHFESARLTDDLGHEYRWATPSGSEAAPGGRKLHLTFTPAADEAATVLTLHIDRVSVAVAL
jgi:hypothetical protein